jgi:hypothetical protein
MGANTSRTSVAALDVAVCSATMVSPEVAA